MKMCRNSSCFRYLWALYLTLWVTIFDGIKVFAGNTLVSTGFNNSTCSSLVESKSQIRSEILEETRALITEAMAKDFSQRFSHEPIRQLRQMGISTEELRALTRSKVSETLTRLSDNQPKIRLSMGIQSQTIKNPSVLNPNLSIADFEEFHQLEIERTAISQVISFGDAPSGDFGKAAESLKIAILTGQEDLAREAFAQCFRYNDFPELTRLAIEIGNNEVLLQIGRLGIARYVFYDRNFNYLNDGLAALSEIEGPLKAQAVALLTDLSDLIVGGGSLQSENQVNTFGVKGNREQYYEDALKVLLSSGQLIGRFPRDSYSFHRIMKFTDLRIKNRVRRLIEKSLDEGFVQDSMSLLGVIYALDDSDFTKSLARKMYNKRFQLANFGDVERRDLRVHYFANLSLEAAMLSGDANFVRTHFNMILENVTGSTTALSLFDAVVFVPPEMLIDVQSYISNLLENNELNSFQRDYLEKSRSNVNESHSKKNEIQPNLNRLGMFLSADNFQHHLGIIEYSLSHESGHEGRWGRFLSAIHQQDVNALKSVYHEMMENGRALDAVYAAIAIAALENGGDIGLLRKRLTLNNKNLLK